MKKGGGNDKADIAPSQGRIRQNLAWEIFRMAGGLLHILGGREIASRSLKKTFDAEFINRST